MDNLLARFHRGLGHKTMDGTHARTEAILDHQPAVLGCLASLQMASLRIHATSDDRCTVSHHIWCSIFCILPLVPSLCLLILRSCRRTHALEPPPLDCSPPFSRSTKTMGWKSTPSLDLDLDLPSPWPKSLMACLDRGQRKPGALELQNAEFFKIHKKWLTYYLLQNHSSYLE
jgi:hypothetical protein